MKQVSCCEYGISWLFACLLEARVCGQPIYVLMSMVMVEQLGMKWDYHRYRDFQRFAPSLLQDMFLLFFKVYLHLRFRSPIGPCVFKSISLISSLKHTGLQYWSPGANVMKHYTAVIYCHSIVIPSFCVIKLYCLGNYHWMAVNYHGIVL